MPKSAPQPIIQSLKGIIQIGSKGTPHEFNRVGVFPPDRNGIVRFTLQGEDCKSIFLTMTQTESMRLAARIMEMTPVGQNHSSIQGDI